MSKVDGWEFVNKSSIISLANIVENEYSGFINQIKKLEVLQFPTRACLEFLLELKREGENNLKEITRIRREVISWPSISDDGLLELDEIRAIRLRLIQSLAPYLDWINGARTQNVPWSFIPTAERLAREIIPQIHPILYSENQYNYRIVWWENPTKEVQRYCFVSLPSLHRVDVLMHGLIGHELFHPRCKQFTSRLEKSVASAVAEECKEAFDIKPDTLFGQRELARLNRAIMFAWERALDELLCDMFCAELFGPAALLGMRAYASFSDWTAQPSPDNNFYPPWQYRFEVVWQNAIDKDCLDKLWDEISKHEDIHSAFESFRTELDRFVVEKALESTSGFDCVVGPEDKLLRIAYTKVKDAIADAHSYVKSYVTTMSVTWGEQRVLVQIPHLVRRLQNGIPPNEIPNFSYDERNATGKYSPDAAELPAILIAGWIYQVYRESKYDKKNSKLVPFETLCRLLLKACEDSEMIHSS